jgi:uncharacterized protein
MKIDVLKLKEGKTDTFCETLQASSLDWGNSEVEYKGDIDISTQALKEGNLLFTKTHLSAMVEYRCCRCLKQCSSKIDKHFNMEYPLDKSEQFVDITEDIRSEIILDYPVKFLCKVDCQGLCPKCGKDLNEGKCNCQMKPVRQSNVADVG